MFDEGVVRSVGPADESGVQQLISTAGQWVVQIPWSDLGRAMFQHPFYVLQGHGRLYGVCGLFVEPETVAHLRVCALDDACSPDAAIARLLDAAVADLRPMGVDTLGFVGMDRWLIEALLRAGLSLHEQIVTLQKDDFEIPEPGSLWVRVRPARSSDWPAILDIERAVFEPLWRNTSATLADRQNDSAFFEVAEQDGQVLGYLYAVLMGHHGHISRIAVRADHHGEGIGVRLLAETVQFFRRRNAWGITLNTQESNQRARRLYEWFGFKLLGQEAQVLIRAI